MSFVTSAEITLLPSRRGADASIRNAKGKSASEVAVMRGKEEVIALFGEKTESAA